MSLTVEIALLTVFALATSIWVGGYVAIGVVARAATVSLDPQTRVAFFRTLGRMYLRVGVPALAVTLMSGAVLARSSERDGVYTSAVVVAVVLIIVFAIAVVQARRMTQLRQALASAPSHAALQEHVRRGARSAGMLRAALGVLSLALVVLGAFMAVR